MTVVYPLPASSHASSRSLPHHVRQSRAPQLPPSTEHTPDGICVGHIERHQLTLHGQPVSVLEAGTEHRGPLVVLLHGLGGHAAHWQPLIASLARVAHVIAPDLLGHGDSGAPRRGDYTAGAHACRMRDLLHLLGYGEDPVDLVGHSFGGGIALSFAYQFPAHTRSLTLICAGGLGTELNIALRAASLPGVTLTARTLIALTPPPLARLIRQSLISTKLAAAAELDALARVLRTLRQRDIRHALIATLRTATSVTGQRIDALDRLYLLAELPTLLIAGRRDRCIPHHHTTRAHELLPHSRLVLLDTGHFPHAEQPDQTAALLAEFLTELGPYPLPQERPAHSETRRAS